MRVGLEGRTACTAPSRGDPQRPLPPETPGATVRRPTVSIRTHQGAIPASKRFAGLMIRHATIVAERLSRCRLAICRGAAETIRSP
jgi:hypothetical protein